MRNPIKTVDESCIGCIFLAEAGPSARPELRFGASQFVRHSCCSFYLRTNIRRGCPAGEGCKRYSKDGDGLILKPIF